MGHYRGRAALDRLRWAPSERRARGGRHTRQVLCERPVNDRCEQARFDAIALTPCMVAEKGKVGGCAKRCRGAQSRARGARLW